MAIDSLSRVLSIGVESASTGSLCSFPGISYNPSSVPGISYNSFAGLSCAQLDRVAVVFTVICRANGDPTAESIPPIVTAPGAPPLLYIPNTFDAGPADRGDGHHDPMVPLFTPCDSTGEGQ